MLDRPPPVHVMLHFGKYDRHIDIEGTRVIQETYPQVQVFEYEAGHGFNCDQRADYESVSAALARRRTLELIETHALPPHHGRDAQSD